MNTKLAIKKLLLDSSRKTLARTHSHIFVPGYSGLLRGALTRVERAPRHGCLRGVTLISVVALIFTGLNKGLDCIYTLGRCIAHVLLSLVTLRLA